MLPSTYFTDKELFKEKRIPGSFYCSDPDSDREQMLFYCCPCGCGLLGAILVGIDFKPDTVGTSAASWKLSGSMLQPSLWPSVHHVNHWHGWLENGLWRTVDE